MTAKAIVASIGTGGDARVRWIAIASVVFFNRLP